MEQLQRRGAIAGIHAFFVSVLVVCALFYRDRLLADLSSYVWHIATTGDFAIFFARYSNALPQWPAVAAAKAGMSLQTIALLFSASSAAYYYVVAAILLHGYRDLRAAFGLLLFFVAVSTHCFIWPIDESGHGLAALFLLPTMMKRRTSPRYAACHALLAVFVCLVAAYFHALAIAAGFLMLTLLLAHPSHFSRRAVLVAMAAMLVFAALRYSHGGIEQDELSALQRPEVMELLGRAMAFARIHFVLLLLSTAMLMLLLMRSLSLLACGFAASAAVMTRLILLRHDPRTAFWVYFWHISTPLYAIFLVVAITAGIVAPRAWDKYFYAGIAALLSIQSALGVIHDVRWHRERQSLILRLTDVMAAREIACAAIDEYTTDKAGWAPWAIVVESMVLTSLNSPSATRALLPRAEVGWHDIWRVKNNARYFALPEDLHQGLFEPLNTAAPVAEIQRTARQAIRLHCETPSQWKPNALITLPVTVENKNAVPLPSRSSDQGPVYLCYAWMQDGQQLPITLELQPLEADIRGSYTQPLRILTPDAGENQSLRCFLLAGNAVIAKQ